MSNAQEQVAPAAAEPLAKLGRSWGWLLAFGILTLIAGILALVWPGPAIVTVAIIFGVQLFVDGIFWFVQAVGSHREGGLVQVLLAVLAIVAGVVVLRSPVATALLLPLVLGLFWTVNGVIETFHAIVREHVPARGWAIAAGVLSVLAGIVLLVYPGLGLVVLTYTLGIWLVVYGGIAAIRAVQMRPRAAAAATPAHPGPAPA
ncbi:HdeD family acid-resistance protein [Saccharopolyspora sp. 5N708]|uniref:HdeD family acid-resistance protein n=1 Tax=Saccharopolyspora sp. 5N708 TaxID=3457424 RepID=UPI003FD61CB6